MLKIIIFLTYLLGISFADTSNSTVEDSYDYLQGKGIFSIANVGEISSDWEMTGTSHIVYIQKENSTSYYMKLEKNVDANLSFSEGLIMNFTESKPQHITFYFSSTNKEQEDTNIRLKDQDGQTVLSFRCGNAGFIRVNDNQMVDFYNFSLSVSDSQIIWTKIDVVLDWGEQETEIFLNDTYKGTSQFYHSNLQNVKTLFLYNLQPNSTSYWKDIQVCKFRCSNFLVSTHLVWNIILSLIILSFVLI